MDEIETIKTFLQKLSIICRDMLLFSIKSYQALPINAHDCWQFIVPLCQ